MPSGMCNFCTYLFSNQFSLFKYVTNMASNNSSILLKQLSHLSLCQPHRLILQTDINLSLPIWSLVNNYLLIFLHNTLDSFASRGPLASTYFPFNCLISLSSSLILSR